MATLARFSLNQIAVVFVGQARIRTFLVGSTGVTAGDAIAITTTGTVVPANTATAGKQQFRGIALETLGPGQGVDVLEEGFIAGFDLTAVAYDSLIYGQDTDGAIGTTAGTKTVPIGRVVPLSDRDSSGNPSKLLYVRANPTQDY